jgi:hypothetical protein
MAIDTTEMMQLLFEACPDLAPMWDEWRNEFKDDPDGPPLFTFLHEVASVLEQMLEDGDEAGTRRVFDLVERLNVEGDRDVQMYATLGIIENTQSLAAMEDGDMVAIGPKFYDYLGAVSKTRWDRVEAMWAGTLNGEDLYA